MNTSPVPAVSVPPRAEKSGLARLSDATLLGLLLLCAALPYLNTLWNQFIFTCDDGTQVLKNPYVHSFRYLREIFSTNVWSYLGSYTITNYYRPLMTVGYLLIFKIFGPFPYGYHLSSLVGHTAVVCMIFVLTRRLISNRGLAFWAAALFALHPIHTEAVDWISSVPELEVTFLFLLTFWLYLGVAQPGGGGSWKKKLAMGGCYVLSLLAKEQALTLPLLASVYEHFYRDDRSETSRAQKVSRYGLLWLLGLIYILVRIQFLGGFAPALQRPRLSWFEAFLAGYALFAQYVWKLFWPVRLTMFHVFPENLRALLPWMIAGCITLTACVWLFAVLWKHNRGMSFAVVWFMVTLAPVLNARWMARNAFAERYLYLPSVGFCWLAACYGLEVWKLASARRAVWRTAALALFAAIAALSTFRIYTRNRDWHDDERLYLRTLEVSPNNFVVEQALGMIYWQEGNYKGAEEQWRRTLLHAPNDPATWNYVGVMFAQRKELDKAVRCFRQSLEMYPSYVDAHLNLGTAYAEQGKMDLAEQQLRAAVVIQPLNFQAHNLLGKVFLDSGRLREAEEQLRVSVQSEPNVAAYDHLGYIYLKWGDGERAERAFKGALSVNATDARAHINLGGIYAAAGRREEALREYQAGLASDPNDAEGREGLERLQQQAPKAHTTATH